MIAKIVTCSDIYVEEFFMYISIKTYLETNENIIYIAPLEIRNIIYILTQNKTVLKKIQDNIFMHTKKYILIDINKLSNCISNITIGQQNVKNKIKEIFLHDMMSEFIKIVNINIIDNTKFISKITNIKCYNNITVNELKKILNLDENNCCLKHNTFILKDDKTLDFYNIDEKSDIYIIRIQRG